MIEVVSPHFNIRDIANSGQCFRINPAENGYIAIADGNTVHIEQQDDVITFDCTQQQYEQYWHHYFDMGSDYGTYLSAIDESDSFLSEAGRVGAGIRILNQPVFETVISFIISQRKSIPAIKTSIEALCRLCGEPLTDGLFAFPTPEALAACTIEQLLSCSVGYRARYIHTTACAVASGEFDLQQLHTLSDEQLLQQLMTLNGVGKKVANCILLFAYHRIAAFPEDVWILKTVDKYYGGNFPHERYKGHAGIMQQYMFYYARGL